MNGQALLFDMPGGKYEGPLIDGKRYGEGKYTYPNGQLAYVGNFVNDVW